MKITFKYKDSIPENFKELEEGIVKKYKTIAEDFPNEDVIFTLYKHVWEIEAPDPVLYQMNVLDNTQAS